jgi:outer membrane biosynthesis protein TonB
MISSAGDFWKFCNLRRVDMRKLLLLIAIGCLAGSAACASAQAKSPSDRPNLEVPPVPPRVIEARVVEPPPPEPAVEELPPVAQLPPQKRTQPPRDTAKVEPKPAEPAPATEQPAASAPVAPPVPQLRTPSTVDGAEATRQIHDVIERAKKGLGSIDYARLSTERRSQYENAKLMVTQSEDELKKPNSNLEFARKLAEKADNLAKELQGR